MRRTVEPTAEKLAHAIARARDVLYLGRGTAYPLALEGALKLKELSYIHAEGYAAGELKHGPIALIDRDLPVVVIASRDATFEKTMSNMHEVIAREVDVTAVGAVEPSDVGWRLSQARRRRSRLTVERIGLDGQSVDAEDASHDAALCTFTLCTIPDALAGLARAAG